MIDCPIYYTVPGDSCGVESNPPPYESASCDGCNCAYLQYESLVPYLKEINDSLKNDPDKAVELEFKLREQIAEISRLFDIDAGVQPGFFSKAHLTTTKVLTTNGTRYLRIPQHVQGTLEVRTMDNVLLDPDSYRYDNGLLVFQPCYQHRSCGCTDSCGRKRYAQPLAWPEGCYQISARWGTSCADMAVQMAVRDYLIEGYRMKDPVIVAATGLPLARNFKVPHSWNTYVNNFKSKRRIFSQFAIA